MSEGGDLVTVEGIGALTLLNVEKLFSEILFVAGVIKINIINESFLKTGNISQWADFV